LVLRAPGRHSSTVLPWAGLRRNHPSTTGRASRWCSRLRAASAGVIFSPAATVPLNRAANRHEPTSGNLPGRHLRPFRRPRPSRRTPGNLRHPHELPVARKRCPGGGRRRQSARDGGRRPVADVERISRPIRAGWRAYSRGQPWAARELAGEPMVPVGQDGAEQRRPGSTVTSSSGPHGWPMEIQAARWQGLRSGGKGSGPGRRGRYTRLVRLTGPR